MSQEATPNVFPYTNDQKRYHTWNYHLNRKFGGKVFKVSLNGGFTCPNRDGLKGTGGCAFCSDSGSGDFAGNPAMDIVSQFYQVKASMHKKWPEARYIAYFQANTNTYAPLDVLHELYEKALALENVVGLSIATRPDAIEEDVLEYLAKLSRRTYLIVELGLQTSFDETGIRVNRGHTYDEFLQAYRRLQSKGINVCVHIINGLPGESKEMMLETVKKLAKLDIHCIKIHLLHVLKDTKIEEEYRRQAFSLLTLEEYVDIVCDQLELLPQDVVIQRLTGDGKKEQLVGPLWSLKKFVVLNEIDKELKRRNSYQGINRIEQL